MPTRAELLTGALETFNAEGMQAAFSYFTPGVVWVAPPEWMGESEFVGADGMLELARIWREAFDDYAIELHEAREIDDRLVALLVQRGRIHGGSDLVEQRIGWVMDYDGDRVRHVVSFFSWEEALREATRS
jgi:hypothetical protein